MTPATEWKDLPTMSDVACAQADGWEIEWSERTVVVWQSWPGGSWSSKYKFRARPRQPKMQVVKSLCWRWPDGSLIWGNEGIVLPWVRFPAGDIEGEVAV